MKKVIFLLVTSLMFAANANDDFLDARDVELAGKPNRCKLTVYETGYETETGEDTDEQGLVNFYADVSVSQLPKIVFHLKTKNGKKFFAYDANTNLRLEVIGWRSNLEHVVSYSVFRGKAMSKPLLACRSMGPK